MEKHFIDQQRLDDINRFVLEHEADIVRDIARLVSIPSVEGPAEPDAPFGRESKRALECGLQNKTINVIQPLLVNEMFFHNGVPPVFK